MSDDVDALFGGRTPPRPSFTDRVTRGQFPPPEAAPAPQPPPPAEAEESAADSGLYKPYSFMPTNSVGEVCEVRGWMNGTEVPEGIVFQYRFLMQVGFAGDDMLKLMLPDCIVVIEGRHLTDLRQKLSRRMVTFIQQYHPRLWPAPSLQEPMVERVEILRPEAFKTRT